MRSRVVAWLRVLLPLAALAILSTLFLIGRSPDPDGAIPYAEVDAEALANDPHMSRPAFSGVADDGSAVTLMAERAATGPGDSGAARQMRLTWRAPEGLAADLTAPNGAVDGQKVQLSGGVRVTTSDGWALTLPEIHSDLTEGRIVGEGGLNAFAPMGQLEAGAMEMSRDSAGQHVLNLTGGVRLIYQP